MVSTGAFDIAAAVKPGLAERARFGSGLPGVAQVLLGGAPGPHRRLRQPVAPPPAKSQTYSMAVSPCQALPWRPRLDLDGRTRYTLGGEGGRISSYDEAWAITPSEALWMLVKPFSE